VELPPGSHLLYIPAVLILGIILGFGMGARAAKDAERAAAAREQERLKAREERAARRAKRDAAAAEASEDK